MKITEQQFFDYISCPALFEMKHIRRIPLDEPVNTKDLLNKVAKYFYLNLLNGKISSTTELRKKWDSLCLKHEDEINNKKVLEGISMIMQLYNWASDEKAVILDLDTPYTIRVGGTELVGNLGTVLSAPGGKYELLVTDFSSRLPDQTMLDMKLKYTLEAYAFHKVKNIFIDGIRVRSVKHAKDYYTDRSDGDFKRLETAIRNVGISIENDLFYPREGMCSTCAAKGYCKYWSRKE